MVGRYRAAGFQVYQAHTDLRLLQEVVCIQQEPGGVRVDIVQPGQLFQRGPGAGRLQFRMVAAVAQLQVMRDEINIHDPALAALDLMLVARAAQRFLYEFAHFHYLVLQLFPVVVAVDGAGDRLQRLLSHAVGVIDGPATGHHLALPDGAVRAVIVDE